MPREQAVIDVFKVTRGGDLAAFTLSMPRAQRVAQRLAQRVSEGDESVAGGIEIHQERLAVDVVSGQVRGNLSTGETVHVVFQYPCGKWESEDVTDPDERRRLVMCGCKDCGDQFVLVEFESADM